MISLQSKPIKIEERYQLQNQTLSIKDVYDAIVELVTNSDDRYEVLGIVGAIEIDVQRARKERSTILRVRDFADGMTSADMDRKLARIGNRVSGLESGQSVRGTNSRGAKDVAALGKVIFESIAQDGNYHQCQIHRTRFTPFASEKLTPAIRKKLGITRGTGTLVTVEIDGSHQVPLHDTLTQKLSKLISLREILSNDKRAVIVKDINQNREDVIRAPVRNGKARVKETFVVPGYPDATAKLVIQRAHKPFDRDQLRFRLGGILIKSRHAIHESTLFDSKLETDPHAGCFFGKLTCPYIDELWNDFDNQMERGDSRDAHNPFPIIDPMRKQGLMRDHPFVKALFGEALKRLRPLVEEERKRVEGERATVESRQTRKRLNKLQQAAAEFMDDKQGNDEPTRDPNSTDTSGKLKERGYLLNPPFVQLVLGHSHRFWLNIRQDAFPELSEGSDVQIQCLTDEITSNRRVCGLEPHPTQEGIIRAVWTIAAQKATSATGVRVRVGPIVDEAGIEVFKCEADKYEHVTALQFSRQKYSVLADGKSRKSVTLMVPRSVISKPTPFELERLPCEFEISGPRVLQPLPNLEIARCSFKVQTSKTDAAATLVARVAGTEATTQIRSVPPKGSGITIKLQDIDLSNQRYRWRNNVLEIATRHPALRRYLGPKSMNFPGQERRHFLVLLAEIVGDAVCSKIIERREAAGEYGEDDCDFNFFSAELSSLMTEFAPLAHKLVVPDEDR